MNIKPLPKHNPGDTVIVTDSFTDNYTGERAREGLRLTVIESDPCYSEKAYYKCKTKTGREFDHVPGIFIKPSE